MGQNAVNGYYLPRSAAFIFYALLLVFLAPLYVLPRSSMGCAYDHSESYSVKNPVAVVLLSHSLSTSNIFEALLTRRLQISESRELWQAALHQLAAFMDLIGEIYIACIKATSTSMTRRSIHRSGGGSANRDPLPAYARDLSSNDYSLSMKDCFYEDINELLMNLNGPFLLLFFSCESMAGRNFDCNATSKTSTLPVSLKEPL